MEVWKKVDGYEDYDVSTLGNVRRFGRNLKPGLSNGYHYVNLSKDKIRKTMTVHRLVALTFIPNPEMKPTVDHIDKVRNNNCLSNLRWATHSEQHLHSPRSGKFGHRHIQPTPYGTYRVRIPRKSFNKNFKSLEEAIEFRDNYLASE